MKSFFRDTWRGFQNEHKKRRSRPKARNRTLAWEALEDRRLLAIVTTPSVDGDALRDEVLGAGVVTPGAAILIQGNGSAGFFTGGEDSITIPEGIILATGPVANADPPNNSENATGVASGLGDADLDALFGVNTTDTTSLEFDFVTMTGSVSFNYVFASEEYNEFVNTAFNDAFGLLIDGVNIALVPGTATPILLNNVNGGNPLGTGATNPALYNNNDTTTGAFNNELGYDGFTDVLVATIDGLTPGTHTVKMTISDVTDQAFDSAVFIESGSFNVIANGSITGTKWDDLDADGIQDPAEPGLPGWTIFIDENGNNMLDTGEPTSVTDVLGNYAFGQLAPGMYTVGEVLDNQPFWTQTFPGPPGTQDVEVGINGAPIAVTDINFGNNLTGLFGVKFHDFNSNGRQDGGEPGLSGWTIFLDTNNNLIPDGGETTTITAADGSYAFANLAPGAYSVREVLQDGWRQTSPAGGFYRVQLANNAKFTELDFGNVQIGGVEGIKWHDLNQNGKIDIGEPRLEGWTIFADLDNSGDLSAGDRRDITDETGAYVLTGLLPGSYVIREVPMTNWEQTFPSAGFWTVTVTAGPNLRNVNVGNKGFASIDGLAFNDLNNNGIFDVGEGVGGIYIFVDLNNDGKANTDEPGTFTKADGRYTINRIEPGTYRLRQVTPPGWDVVDPITGFMTVELEAGEQLTGQIFEEAGAIDWGDAPSIYPTLAVNDGANHGTMPGFQLGPGGFGVLKVDAEVDGQPDIGAVGDDLAGRDDEDGVVIGSPWLAGTTVPVIVTGSIGQDVVKGKLNGWVDFNADGDWNDYGEQVFYDLIIKSGENKLWINVPDFAPSGPTYARFRISTEWNLPAFGPARDGEVEDYVVTIDNPYIPFGFDAFVLGGTTDDTLEDLYVPGPSTLFEVTANLTGILTAQTSFDHDLGNIDLAIYNTAGELLGQSSSVTDTEQVNIASVAGERYLIRLFGHNPKVDLRTMNMIATNGEITIVGTPGNDTVELTAPTATTPIGCTDCIELVVNDIVYLFDAPNDFVFLGLGGDDALTVNSNANDDDITFRTGSVVVTNPQYTMSAWYVKDIHVDAADGADTARFFNPPGPDAFTSQPEFSERIAPYLSQRADSVERVLAYADGDSDTAFVTGTSGDDRLVGGEASSFLTSPTFFVYLDAFESLFFNGGEGNNTATVSDSAGDDLAVGVGRVATMAAATFRIDMRDFARVNFISSTGFDRANFTGSAGDDLLVGRIAGTYLMTDTNFFYAHGFSRVIVDGGRGLDRAFFRGTTGVAETFVAKELDAWLVSAGSFIRGKNFETNRGFGSAEDTSVFYDTMRAENYIAQTTFVLMTSSGTDMISYAEGFGTTRAFATPGTGDKATMSDSPLDDIFYANSFAFFLSGMDFFNQGAGFDTVTATSTTGIDTLTVDGVPGFTLTIIGPWI